jgi:hypothetical protein
MTAIPFRWASLACAVCLTAALAAHAAAQETLVDEGSFTIFRKGARVGRETFTIRRSVTASEDVYVANATVDFDAQRLTPALRTDTSYAPLAYQMEVRTNDQLQLRLKGVIGRGRFSARVKTPTGALVIDDDVFHQYYFLAKRLKGVAFSVPVVIPTRNVQQTMHVQPMGVERVVIGGTPTDARRLNATISGGMTRDIWVDAQGRVLKVTLGDVSAVRDEMPR